MGMRGAGLYGGGGDVGGGGGCCGSSSDIVVEVVVASENVSIGRGATQRRARLSMQPSQLHENMWRGAINSRIPSNAMDNMTARDGDDGGGGIVVEMR